MEWSTEQVNAEFKKKMIARSKGTWPLANDLQIKSSRPETTSDGYKKPCISAVQLLKFKVFCLIANSLDLKCWFSFSQQTDT